MQCKELRRLWPEYLDGEVSAAQQREIRAHLLKCRCCEQQLGPMGSLLGKLHCLPDPSPPSIYIPPSPHRNIMTSWRRAAAVALAGACAAAVLLPALLREFPSSPEEIHKPEIAPLEVITVRERAATRFTRSYEGLTVVSIYCCKSGDNNK